MTAKDIRNRSLDGAFLAQLGATLVLVGIDVLSEVGTTPNHAERLTYAYKVFGQPEAEATKLVFAIACLQSIQDVAKVNDADWSVPDATLKTAVAGAWNTLRQVP